MNMISPIFRRTTALVFILAAGVALTAQETGTLSGVVRDNAGRPIQGVLVSITSPNMLGVRNITTNERGEYRVPLLPAGNYRISVSRQGYLGQRAENIRIGLGASASQNFTMRVATQAEETVEITAGGELGMVDKTETGAKTNVSAETLSILPVNRTFSGVAQLTPGITTTANNNQFIVRGGQGQQTMYRLNGADIKDDYEGVVNTRGTVQDNIEDVQVVLSETHARFGRTLGGSINVITKSGSNTFSGSMRATLSKESWKGTNEYTSFEGDVFNDNLSPEFQWTLNGPIIKDRVWFALSGVLKPSNTNSYTIGNVMPNVTSPHMAWPGFNNAATVYIQPGDPVNAALSAGPPNWPFKPFTDPKFDSFKGWTNTTNTSFYDFKITAMPIQNHTFEVGYTRDELIDTNKNIYGYESGQTSLPRLEQMAGEQNEMTQVYNFGYKGIIGDNIFIEARYNKFDSVARWPEVGMDVSERGELFYVFGGRDVFSSTGTGAQVGLFGNAVPFGIGLDTTIPSDRSNRSGNLNIKWIKDFFDTNHEIDVGVDYYRAKLFEPSSNSSGMQVRSGGYYESSDPNLKGRDRYMFSTINYEGASVNGTHANGVQGPAAIMYQYFGQEGVNFTDSWAYYINDKFVINQHWNGMIGLRFESSSMTNSRGVKFADSTFLSPRFQLTYDLNGDNAHLFTATVARYGTDFNARFLNVFAETAASLSVTSGWTANPYNAYDLNDPTGQAGVRFYRYEDMINPANYEYIIAYADATKTRVIGDLEVPYMDEFTIGYKRQLRNGSSVGLTYVNRTWYNDWAAASEYQSDYFAEVEDPTGSGLPSQYGRITRWFNAGSDLKRDFQSLEMEFTARLNSYWTVGGNWTLSRLTGNDEGGDRTGSGDQTFASYTTKDYYNERTIYAKRDITTDMVSPYGRLGNDRTHRGRLYAILQLPLGQGHVSFSPMLFYNSGAPSAFTITNSLRPVVDPIPRPDGNGNQTGVPATWTEYLYGRRWIQGNDHFYVDFNVSFAVPLGMKGSFRRMQMIGNVDVKNLFNARIYGNGFYNGYSTVADQYFRFTNTAATLFGTVNPVNGNYWRDARSASASLGLRF